MQQLAHWRSFVLFAGTCNCPVNYAGNNCQYSGTDTPQPRRSRLHPTDSMFLPLAAAVTCNGKGQPKADGTCTVLSDLLVICALFTANLSADSYAVFA